MSLNLRRQLLVAVCDNVVLQNQLATQLENDLAQMSWLPARGGSAASGGGSLALERLVFDPEDAHLPRQVAHWVRQTLLSEGSLPQVQMLGIEQMTRQPAIIQNHFLRSLEQIEALLPRLNTSLLVWVPWPWLRTIQSSSPTFWKWRNGVFEFVSDPTPALSETEGSATGSSSDAQTSELQSSFKKAVSSRQDRSFAEASAASSFGRDRVSNSKSNVEHYPAEHYPSVDIDPHQVVALYGEADDSDMGIYGHPTLETIATWDTVDVAATTMPASPTPQESSTAIAHTPQSKLSGAAKSAVTKSASAKLIATKLTAKSADSEQKSLLAAATAALSAYQAAIYRKNAQAKALPQNDTPEQAKQPHEQQLTTARGTSANSGQDQPAQPQPAVGSTVQSQPTPQTVPQPIQSQTASQPLPATPQTTPADNPNPLAQQDGRLPAQQGLKQPSSQQSLSQSLPPKQSLDDRSPSKPSTPQQQTSASTAVKQASLIQSLPAPAKSKRSTKQSQLLLEKQRVQRQSAADGYFEVGRSYRTRIEAGNRGLDIIEPAIAAYEGGLRCLSGPHPDWGSGLNDLGTLYWLKAQQLDDQQQVIDCMNHSIELYSQALSKVDLTQSTDMACQLYSNLGAVFSMLAVHKDPVINFNKASKAYQKALSFCPMILDPIEFATLQNSLGSVYWKLSHYEQNKEQIPLYLQQAIVAYEQAGLGYDPPERPLDYAAVQNNLGITYWSMAKHKDTASALKRAIFAYRDALKYRTPQSDAAACAITYNNLALAYWDFSKVDDVGAKFKLRCQRSAVKSFDTALKTADIVGSLSKEDSAAIHHCLGDVCAQIAKNAPSQEEVINSLKRSLNGYVQAIDGVSMESPIFQTRLSAIVANLRSHREQINLASQQAALNQVPAHLISLVMQSL